MSSELRDPAYRDILDASGSKAPGFAQQILATTAPFLEKPPSQLDVLDLGCGYGHTALELARHCHHVVGMEPSTSLHEGGLRLARDGGVRNVELRRAGIDGLDETGKYDLIVLDNVFEHLPDQRDALQRLSRALRPGGALYILTPNKLWPIEAHYALPFLAWLPLPLANAYLRLTRRGTDYTDASYAPTYGRIKRLFRAHPELTYAFVLPENLALTHSGAAFHYRVGVALIRRFPSLWRISKSFLVIARKR
jgi:SAM-dependent methyltransferase